MKKLLVLCCLVTLCAGYAEAGLSKIKSLKLIVSASIASPEYIQSKDIADEITNDLKAKLPDIVLKNSSGFICEVRYSDDYKLSANNEMYGSYYMSVVIKSLHKSFDKVAPSSKVYWERGFFMPLIACKSLNASVKENIGAFVNAFAEDWLKDQLASKESD